eukprot:TRINITY_DN31879_c0_g1_i1.p1 TRINITY_DN31879_c0_g1~~TRINITY_DN31879_c0_g1_i1.p1  ORF type:complete len:571 (+),score=67.15 TRINITY_DN31879_c0_g1_i1:33-1715(+)
MTSGETAAWDGSVPGEEYLTQRAQFRQFKAAKLRSAFFIRLGILVAVWFFGGVIFAEMEPKWTVGDGLFFTAVTISTIGYGFTYPTRDGTKVFLVLYASLALAILASLLSSAIQLYVYSQRAFHKKQEKWSAVYRHVLGSIAALAVIALLGSIIFASEADWPLSTGIYFVTCTIGTVGYGDFGPATGIGNFFLTLYIFLCEAVKAFLVCALSHVSSARTNPSLSSRGQNRGNAYSTFGSADDHEGVTLSLPAAPADPHAHRFYQRLLIAIIAGTAVLCLIWAAFLSSAEGWSYGTAAYYVIITITTVAYGDVTVATTGGRLLVSLFVTLVVAIKFAALFALQRYRFLLSEADKTGPIWVVDETSAFCTGCKQPFSVVRRRHHCRHCGRIYCAPCSRWRSFIPKYGYADEATRVCLPCYEQLKGELARAAPPPPTGRVAKALRSAQQHWVVASLCAFFLFLLGAGIFAAVESWRFVDGFYFAAITLMTIGYGDLVVQTGAGKAWLIFFAFLGLALFTQLVSVVQKVSSRNVQRSMQVAREQLIALPIPNVAIPAPTAAADL